MPNPQVTIGGPPVPLIFTESFQGVLQGFFLYPSTAAIFIPGYIDLYQVSFVYNSPGDLILYPGQNLIFYSPLGGTYVQGFGVGLIKPLNGASFAYSYFDIVGSGACNIGTFLPNNHYGFLNGYPNTLLDDPTLSLSQFSDGNKYYQYSIFAVPVVYGSAPTGFTGGGGTGSGAPPGSSPGTGGGNGNGAGNGGPGGTGPGSTAPGGTGSSNYGYNGNGNGAGCSNIVSWNAVAGATAYTLQSSPDNATWTTIYVGLATSFGDAQSPSNNGKTIYYQVSATTSGGMSPYTTSTAIQTVCHAWLTGTNPPGTYTNGAGCNTIWTPGTPATGSYGKGSGV